ncbi:2-keto-4-pentenoate hydratase [Nocardioides soli]|uniref:2-oxo-3-hexenedioate decarboxylase n=1 Tax=Nocardioides soli TaxID=1036020 RepID=A0A7W4Z0K6_9ACTN|nr:fumarylacetoacetate hydrolase family protein [Nocardioides soli]MBB3042394.1 2-oxo-3-hexenedioate decarboxylase [Nocardioides soli]
MEAHPDAEAAGRLTALLHGAAERAEAVRQPDHELSEDLAYAVQRGLLDSSLAAGDTQAGVKLGFTSRAKMEQMGIDSVIAGFLLASSRVPDGGELDRGRLIHPRVEPEIAFRIGRDIGRDESPDAVVAAVDAVAPALEVIDSRYRDFRFRLGDVIADNTSAARWVVGPWQEVPPELDARAVSLSFDDDEVAAGSTAAILGDPWEALRQLRGLTADHLALRAGYVVLAGAATEAVALPASGRVRVRVAGLGEASLVVGCRP